MLNVISSINEIKRLVFFMESMNVYCEILIEFLKIYYMQFVLKIVNKVHIGLFFLELVSG